MNDDFIFDGVDGKQLIEMLWMSTADRKTASMCKVFKKYNISIFDGMSMLLELCSVLKDENGGENDIYKKEKEK